ncbi:MAG: globin [Aquabacterium sp.]
MTTPQPPCTTDASDLALIDRALELAAQTPQDVTLQVYPRFFARCPAAAPLFTPISPDFAPHGCANMVMSIIELLRDAAAGKGYVAGYARQIADEHRSFGVHEPALYADFLDSLRDELAAALGPQWTPAMAQAWARQAHMLAGCMQAAAVPPAATAMPAPGR